MFQGGLAPHAAIAWSQVEVCLCTRLVALRRDCAARWFCHCRVLLSWFSRTFHCHLASPYLVVILWWCVWAGALRVTSEGGLTALHCSSPATDLGDACFPWESRHLIDTLSLVTLTPCGHFLWQRREVTPRHCPYFTYRDNCLELESGSGWAGLMVWFQSPCTVLCPLHDAGVLSGLWRRSRSTCRKSLVDACCWMKETLCNLRVQVTSHLSISVFFLC